MPSLLEMGIGGALALLAAVIALLFRTDLRNQLDVGPEVHEETELERARRERQEQEADVE